MKTLLLLTLILLVPITVSATSRDIADCEVKAETVRVVIKAHENGVDKAKLLLVYQGSDEYNVAIRAMIHAIYRGIENPGPDAAYEMVYDMCMAK